MAFIRTRKGKYFDSNQLIESYREDGKVKQRIIGNLRQFNNVPDAIAFWKRHISGLERGLSAMENHLKVAEERVKDWRARDDEWREKHGRPFYERPPEHRNVECKWPRYYHAEDEAKALERLAAAQPEREARWLNMGRMFGLKDEHLDIEEFRKTCIEEATTQKVKKTHRELVEDITSQRKLIEAEKTNLAALESYQAEQAA